MTNQEYINSHPEQFKDFQQEFDNLWFGNLEEYFNHDAADYANIRSIALHFVNWQYEQFEKERLKHCDELTAEQAQIESDFVVQHLKNFNRTPTFIDAIEYGRESMRERLTKLEELADKMYYAAQYLTTDASKLRKAMRDYWHYVNYELNEERYETGRQGESSSGDRKKVG